LLFALLESDWNDTRALAFDLLRSEILLRADSDLAILGLDGLMGLLDSTRLDVQEAGRALVHQRAAELPLGELASRLAQHPDPGMRRFAIEVIAQHYPTGEQDLAALKSFARAALLDVRPNRKVKRQVIDFLTARGLRSHSEAEVVAAVLGDLIRLQGKTDFENALEALVRLKLAYPELQTTVSLHLEDVV
jgi:hypothetical protein